ncbi:MAG: hypothetical protein HXK14_02095 [Actinomyces sp.]|nr:hypothetical protein [Actinomyces sp.]
MLPVATQESPTTCSPSQIPSVLFQPKTADHAAFTHSEHSAEQASVDIVAQRA